MVFGEILQNLKTWCTGVMFGVHRTKVAVFSITLIDTLDISLWGSSPQSDTSGNDDEQDVADSGEADELEGGAVMLDLGDCSRLPDTSQGRPHQRRR